MLNHFAGGIDYNSESHVQVIFPDGKNTTSFDVKIINDDIFDENETFYVTIDPLSLPYGVVLGNIASATVTILDDDSKYN